MTKETRSSNDEGEIVVSGVVTTNRTPEGKTEKVFDLEERTALFGEAVIEFCEPIKLTAVTDPLVRQIIRSGTSVGSNYCEADDAVSGKEFRQKIGTCKKESRETKFWLRMIAKAEPARADLARTRWKEANELHLIFASIFRKLSSSETKNKKK
jgi:four helix bundle protein